MCVLAACERSLCALQGACLHVHTAQPGALLTACLHLTLPPAPQDIGGCGQRGPVDHHLGSQPRVFTLQLGWESHGEAPEAIAATLAAVDETVRWVWGQ